jgi:hypothetical protein
MSSFTDNTDISGNNLGGIDVTIDGVTFHNYEGPPTQDAFSYIINPNTTYLDTSFNFVETKNVSLYYFDLHTVVPNTSVSYSIICLDDEKKEVLRIDGRIEGEEYDNWGQDDQYILDIIKSKVMSYKNT